MSLTRKSPKVKRQEAYSAPVTETEIETDTAFSASFIAAILMLTLTILESSWSSVDLQVKLGRASDRRREWQHVACCPHPLRHPADSGVNGVSSSVAALMSTSTGASLMAMTMTMVKLPHWMADATPSCRRDACVSTKSFEPLWSA